MQLQSLSGGGVSVPTNSISSLERRGAVGILAIDSPPVNALGHAVRAALRDGLNALIADEAVKAVIVRCDGRTFFAGADISEFGKPFLEPDLNTVFDIIEASPKPVVAAIHGTALGGGFELALACHYRVAAASARVGLPEVSLGLLPGAGGTQRAPRLAGVAAALDLIVTGRPVKAAAALDLKLIDAVVSDAGLADEAVAFAQALIADAAPLRRVRDMETDLKGDDARAAIAAYQQKNARLFRGPVAPGNIAKAVEAAATLPFEAGLKREYELFEELMNGRQSAAQRHIFFAERAAGKVVGLPRDVQPVAIRSVAVVGAGTMGTGIATAFLSGGYGVTLIDLNAEAVARAEKRIHKTVDDLVAKGRLADAAATAQKGRLSVASSLDAVADADLIVEAVYENLDLKKDVFRQLDGLAKADAVLASNTSFLDLDAIAAATGRPQRVIGLHFFAPANIMRLLEVVRGAATAPEIVATGMALGRALGKVAVLSGVCDGFIANRAMAPRVAAAERLILEGPMPWDVDRVMTAYGFPMGVFSMLDLVGLDVIGWDRETSAGRTVQEVLCERGHWGQKTGQGYYLYDENRRATPSPEAEEVIRRFAAPTASPLDDEALLERLLYPVVNEGAKIVEEGIAQRASDVDAALVTGYGWPVWTGGPMFWADTVGLDKVIAGLERTLGPEAVSPLLRRTAERGEALAEQTAPN